MDKETDIPNLYTNNSKSKINQIINNFNTASIFKATPVSKPKVINQGNSSTTKDYNFTPTFNFGNNIKHHTKLNNNQNSNVVHLNNNVGDKFIIGLVQSPQINISSKLVIKTPQVALSKHNCDTKNNPKEIKNKEIDNDNKENFNKVNINLNQIQNQISAYSDTNINQSK